ncbi:MAG: hypothetical protein R3C49_21280 [Planctomycetaceae bacterium]
MLNNPNFLPPRSMPQPPPPPRPLPSPPPALCRWSRRLDSYKLSPKPKPATTGLVPVEP